MKYNEYLNFTQKMSYGNMDEEMKQHQTYLRQSEITLGKLSYFIKDFGKSGVRFIERSQKIFEEFIIELKKEDESTTLNISLSNIFNEYTSFFNKFKETFNSIDKEVGEKISDFEKEYKIKNKENVANLNKISMRINESKQQLDKIKNVYFDSCKEIIDIEKKIDPKKLSDEDLLRMTQKRIKAKENGEEKKEMYQKEVKKFNQLLDSLEDEYIATLGLFKNEQNSKILLYIDILNNLNTISKKHDEVLNNNIAQVNKFKEKINIRRDLKLYEHDFNHLNSSSKKRFMKENFLNYDLRRRNSKVGNENNNEEELSIDDQDSKYMKALQILELGKDDFIDITSLNDSDIELDNYIVKLLDQEDKITDEVHLKLIEFYKDDISHTKRFIYLLVNHFCIKEFVQIKSVDNFKYLNNILTDCINFCFEKKEIFELIFLIMFISGKTIYFNIETNHIQYYLCDEMRQNKLLNTLEFWSELLKKRVELIAEVEITKEMEKRKDSQGKSGNNLINNAIGTIGKFGKFLGIGGEDNKVIEKEILYNQFFQKNCPKYCNTVIEYYLKEFINYNFYGENAIKLIDQMGIKYNLPKESREYYKEVIKTNEIIKNKMKKSKDLIIENGDYDKYYFNFKGNKSFKGIKDQKISGLVFCLKYLDIKEYPKLLCLNKETNKNLTKIIYKNILFKYFDKIDIKTHLSIWKVLLNYTEIKKKYNYQKILEEVKKDPNSVQNIDIIQLDIIRTSFDKDEEVKRGKIGNILKAISKELPSLNYCQGMNQIAAFLLDVCDNNEEEAFFIFLCLMIDSDYSNLFKNELERLNILFYQFERILSNTLPEIYFYLINNNITPGYFVSPWFITLFTDAFIDKESDNNKKNIMKVFDLFIFSGFKAITKIGISLLKYNESKIISTPIEELLNYLTNDIIKSKYFEKGNINDILNSSIKFKINGIIISETEKQFYMKKSLPKFE